MNFTFGQTSIAGRRGEEGGGGGEGEYMEIQGIRRGDSHIQRAWGRTLGFLMRCKGRG